MRIIGGKFRSRKLYSPANANTTRPIPDRVKESLFNLLRGHFEGARVVDCFAGSGSIGLEALSRGAEHCVFVERDKRACDLLERNITLLGCTDSATLVRGDALGPAVFTRIAAMGGVDLLFLDPPYPLVLDPGSALGGSGGWDRVKSQFERLIGSLSDKGFATIRTPWPFRHLDLIHSASSDPENGGHGTGITGTAPHAGPHRSSKGKRSPKIERSWIIGSGSVGQQIDVDAIQESSRRLERKLRTGPSGAAGVGGSGGGGAGEGGPVRADDDDDDFDLDLAGHHEHEDHDDREVRDEYHEHDAQDYADDFDNDDGLDGTDELEDPSEPDAVGPDANSPHPNAASRTEPPRVYVEPDLNMIGAVGPETHAYGSTAVHLFMRQR